MLNQPEQYDVTLVMFPHGAVGDLAVDFVQVGRNFSGVSDSCHFGRGGCPGCDVVEFAIWAFKDGGVGPSLGVEDKVARESSCFFMCLAEKDPNRAKWLVERFPFGAAWVSR